MKNGYKILAFTLLNFAFIACNDAEKKDAIPEPTEDTEVTTPKQTPKAEKRELSKTEQKQVNSVLTRIMVTPEAKSFTSALVTAGLTDILSKQEGPFTVFVPTNKAFDGLGEAARKKLLSPARTDSLQLLLKSHIVQGAITSSDLVQGIKEKGRVSMNTLGEMTLTAKMDGSQIVIENESGNSAIVGKSDIEGSNGTVHLLDGVLRLN